MKGKLNCYSILRLVGVEEFNFVVVVVKQRTRMQWVICYLEVKLVGFRGGLILIVILILLLWLWRR
jgi:hypothetical protein